MKPPTLAYRLASDELHGCARVEWEGPVAASADDLVNIEPAEEREERQSATDFLREVLAEGPRLSREVEKEASEAHYISRSTLKRARRSLGAVAYQEERQWYIKLPEDTSGGQGFAHREWTPDPLTGPRCAVCGEPMTVVEEGQTTHPGCEPEDNSA